MTLDYQPNRLEWQLERLQEVPVFARNWFRSVVMRRAVPFAGTAGLDFLQVTTDCAEVRIKTSKKFKARPAPCTRQPLICWQKQPRAW